MRCQRAQQLSSNTVLSDARWKLKGRVLGREGGLQPERVCMLWIMHMHTIIAQHQSQTAIMHQTMHCYVFGIVGSMHYTYPNQLFST